MSSTTRKWLPLLVGVFLAALIGCGVGCIIAIKATQSASQPPVSAGHDWLHDRLEITPEQRLKLEEIEERFEERETQLKAELVAANEALGKIIKEERAYTPKVKSMLEKIHHAVAELQNATIEHLFEMEEDLTPEQYELLLELAGDALH